MKTTALVAFLALTCTGAAPAPVQWSGKDVAGHAVELPQRNRACLVVFVRTDQPRSHDALTKLRSLSKEQLEPLQVTVVLSGEQAAERAKELARSGECPWPAVADPEYRAADALAVRVWPTTLLILPSGQVAAHLAGLPPTYARDLDAHVSFATGAIGEAERDRRLANGDAVADTPQQAAQRRVETARRLLDKGMTEQALALLDEKTENALPRWQVALLRGTASAQAGDWEAARKTLQEATKLNPEPAEAWYRLGLVFQHLKEWEQAAAAFRHAFEATDAGRAIHSIPAARGEEPHRQ
jgi:tetratricopeptide (TPR) repeat protein